MTLLNVNMASEAIQEVALKFEIEHIVNPDARQVGMSFARLAQELCMRIRRDDEGLVECLEMLLEARDAAILAATPRERRPQEQARQERKEAAARPQPKPAPPRVRKTTASRSA